MGEDELRLAQENLRGQLRRLDTVLKMSMAEQRRVNADLVAAVRKYKSLAHELERLIR